MKRRDFLKTSAAAAGMVGSFTMEPTLAGAEGDSQAAVPPADHRPAEYLRRVRNDRYLPKEPAPGRTYLIAPMLAFGPVALTRSSDF